MVIRFDQEKVDPKRIAQIIVSTAALAFAIFLAIWIIDYFNKEINMIALTNLNTFLISSWPILVGFVLIIGLWDYLFRFFKKWLKYAKPLVEGAELVFGLWLVVVFFDGIRIFNTNPQVDFFLKFPNELFFTQFIMVALLIIFIKYSQFFLAQKNIYPDDMD